LGVGYPPVERVTDRFDLQSAPAWQEPWQGLLHSALGELVGGEEAAIGVASAAVRELDRTADLRPEGLADFVE